MRKGGLGAGILLLAALAGLVWYELRKDEKSGVMQPGTVVFPYNPGRVQEFTATIGSRAATFRRGPSGGFEVAAGPEGVVPEAAADFLAAASRVRFLDVVQETVNADDLKRFGLQPPAAVVKVTLRPPSREGEVMPEVPPALEIGGASPVLPGYYARVNGFERVVLVGAEAADLVEGSGLEIFGEESKVVDAPRESGVKEVPSGPRKR